MTKSMRLGVDIGGTFTDLVAVDEHSGEILTHKLLTTPDDPARAVEIGLRELLEANGLSAQSLLIVIHGTTLFTNTLIERTGAKVAVITTQGFRDLLEMGTEMRYDIYDLHLEMPDPLVPRSLRFEVHERMNAQGEVVHALDEAQVRTVAEQLLSTGVEAVAVVYLHSYLNDEHEERTRAVLSGLVEDGVSLSLSSEVAPEIREYERTSTTVANAYVQPLAERYLGRIQEGLERLGYEERLFLMLSSGGITSLETAQKFPVRLVESGPTAGVLAASFIGSVLEREDIVSFDMGGTTAKIGLIVEGKPERANMFEVARIHRFKRGSGFPISIPAIELIEIGAGGGSIATIDEIGLLKVGPRSAGAEPGPACYGKGGALATVTDADLVLGLLNPEFFLGGAMCLDRAASERVIGELADQLSLDIVEVAAGIHRIVNEGMIAATRVHIAERGQDARRFSMVAFGGAGPVHAYAIAEALRLKEIICPPSAGVASALGFLTAPISFDVANSFPRILEKADLADLESRFSAMEADAIGLLQDAGVPLDQIEIERAVDMRHVGQGYEISVPLPKDGLIHLDRSAIAEQFFDEYERLYEHRYEGMAAELMTLRVHASAPEPQIKLSGESHGQSLDNGWRGERQAYFVEHGWKTTDIYERSGMPPGLTINGPAIVESVHSTAVVAPSMVATIERSGALIMTRQEGNA